MSHNFMNVKSDQFPKESKYGPKSSQSAQNIWCRKTHKEINKSLLSQVEPIPSKPPRSFASSSTMTTNTNNSSCQLSSSAALVSSPPDSSMATSSSSSLPSPMQQSITSPSSTISSQSDSPSSPIPSNRQQILHDNNRARR